MLNPSVTHPNATSVAKLTAAGALLMELVNHFTSLNINDVEAVTIVGAFTALRVFIGRDGIVGAWHRLLHGTTRTAKRGAAK